LDFGFLLFKEIDEFVCSFFREGTADLFYCAKEAVFGLFLFLGFGCTGGGAWGWLLWTFALRLGILNQFEDKRFDLLEVFDGFGVCMPPWWRNHNLARLNESSLFLH
jgi:hypothetical protein